MTAIEGGCLCGAIRYRVTAPLAGTAACHCRKCQYGSGGGPNYVALAPRDAFEIVHGDPVRHLSTAESGAEVTRAFCGACGAPLYSDSANLPALALRVGSLDAPSAHGPWLHIWVEAAQPWHHVTPGAKVRMRGAAD